MAAFAALPLALKALGLGTTAISAVPVAEHIGGIGRRREEELIKQGPTNTAGDYSDLGAWDKLWVNEESLMPRRQKYQLDQLKKENPQISVREGELNIAMKPGESLGDFYGRTAEPWEAHQRKKKGDTFRHEQGLQTGSIETLRSNRLENEANRRHKVEMADRKSERHARDLRDAQQWRDNLGIRQDTLDFNRQQQSEKMDIYRQQLSNQRADKKQERMMALIQGLATLGSGFAL